MVYAKKISAKERKWLADFEKSTHFEAMYQDEIDSGEMTFLQVAHANVDWYRLHCEDMAQQAEADLYNGAFGAFSRPVEVA